MSLKALTVYILHNFQIRGSVSFLLRVQYYYSSFYFVQYIPGVTYHFSHNCSTDHINSLWNWKTKEK